MDLIREIETGASEGNAFVNLDPKQHFNPLYYRRETVNDMDAISLTTDDLLRLPADGCFSFPCVPPDHRPNKKYSGRQDSSDIKNSPSFYVDATSKSKNNIVPPYVYTNINGKKCGRPRTPKPINRENKCVSESSLSFPKESSFTEDSAERRLEKNYPRWLTSQKSDLSVSGVTSIPDVKYPIWLHNQDLLPEANTPRGYKLLNEDEYRPIHSYQTQRANQLLNKIDCFEYTFKPSNLTDSFSEYEGLGDKIELLILKAKKNLKQSAKDLPKPVEKDDSPCSLDKLEAERTWENVPVAFKSPVPVKADDSPQQSSRTQCVNAFLEDFLNGENQVSEDDLAKLQMKENMMPITRSLHKALQHLSRLRDLVDDTSGRQPPKK